MSEFMSRSEAQMINRQVNQLAQAVGLASVKSQAPAGVFRQVTPVRRLDVFYPRAGVAAGLFADPMRNAGLALGPGDVPCPVGAVCLPMGFAIPRAPVKTATVAGEITGFVWGEPVAGWVLPVVAHVKAHTPGKPTSVTCLVDAGRPTHQACADISCGFCHVVYAVQQVLFRLRHPGGAFVEDPARVRGKDAPRLPRRLHLLSVAKQMVA